MLITIPFVIYELVLSPHFPTTHNLVNDWANHAHRFTVFLLGYFAAKHVVFWRSADRALPLAAVLVVSLLISGFWMEANEEMLAASSLAQIPFIDQVIDALDILYAWSFMVLLFGLAQRYLNRPSKALTYLTGAVFCYYILHQTIIVIAGYNLTQMQFGPWPEFLAVTLVTVAGCTLGYEAFRRIPGVRPWFGIKAPPAKAKSASLDGAAAS